jgi:ribonuclease VapC
MILDTSALAAIAFAEPDADLFLTRIRDTEVCRLSVANHLELLMVLQNRFDRRAPAEIEDLLLGAKVRLEPVDVEQSAIAQTAFLEFGKGRHPARLNFGDCFAYALAKAKAEPLLFKGRDFRLTDIEAAI